MNLRNLLNPTRFAGCVNGRLEYPLFRKAEEAPCLSLFCEELPDGRLALMTEREGRMAAAASLDVPEYLRERIVFWNRWASRAVEYEYELTPSLYGLEAYGISLAMEFAALFPECLVTYGGLPVNAEQQLAPRIVSFPTYEEQCRQLPLPAVSVQNPYMKRLLAGQQTVTTRRHACIFEGWVDDWYANFFFTVYQDREAGCFSIAEEEGFPAWLVQRMENLETAWIWRLRDAILMPFWEDALSVDIARFAQPLLPVSFTPRYITGEDVLAVCRND